MQVRLNTILKYNYILDFRRFKITFTVTNKKFRRRASVPSL